MPEALTAASLPSTVTGPLVLRDVTQVTHH